MKSIRRITLIFPVMLTLGYLTFVSTPVHAATPKPYSEQQNTQSVTQELHITAQVLPAQKIIVDYNGRILEIVSNTSGNIVPLVYVQTDSPNNQIKLTDSIRTQYRALVPIGTAKPGILYKCMPSSCSRSSVTAWRQYENSDDGARKIDLIYKLAISTK